MYIQIPFNEFIPEDELVPQAIIGLPPSFFAGLGVEIETGCDDLDNFEGAGFLWEDDQPDTSILVPFLLIRHRGNPDNTTTIQIPMDIEGDEMRHMIEGILAEFGLTKSNLVWHRDDGVDFAQQSV